eukprot:556878-Rhodomonas_salina.7
MIIIIELSVGGVIPEGGASGLGNEATEHGGPQPLKSLALRRLKEAGRLPATDSSVKHHHRTSIATVTAFVLFRSFEHFRRCNRVGKILPVSLAATRGSLATLNPTPLSSQRRRRFSLGLALDLEWEQCLRLVPVDSEAEPAAATRPGAGARALATSSSSKLEAPGTRGGGPTSSRLRSRASRSE